MGYWEERSVGVLEYWGAAFATTPPLHHSATPLFPCSITPFLPPSITPTLQYSTTPLFLCPWN
jgi:hypothetical protein